MDVEEDGSLILQLYVTSDCFCFCFDLFLNVLF